MIPLLIAWLLFLSVNSATAQQGSHIEEPTFPRLEFAGFLQQQFTIDQDPDLPATFPIKRARVGVAGVINDFLKLNVVGGFVEPPVNTPRLVNAFLDFDIDPLVQLRTGQFLLPFGLEGPEPIFINPAIERAHAIRRLNTFTMFRDLGVQLSGKRSQFGYAVAFVNGAGANRNATIDPRDVMGRIQFAPMENLVISLSAHWGAYQPLPGSEDYENRTRVGTDFSYDNETLRIRGEGILRRDQLPPGGTRKMWGGYRFSKTVETIARVEHYDPDAAREDDRLRDFTLGFNFSFYGNSRLSVNYEFMDDRTHPGFGNQLTAQMQVVL